MNLDREILLCVLAYELGFVPRAALVEAAKECGAERNKPPSALLAERGELTAQRQSLVAALVDEQIQLHDGDAARALASFSARPPVGAELERILRPRLDATLADLSLTLPSLMDESDAPPRLLGMPSSATGRYRILRPHAKGGLGEVFVAHDGELKREVALKQIQPHADAADNRARFVLEAEITGGLEHPGVVPVYGLGTDAQGRPFYAMRFIKGESLKEAIKRFHHQRESKERTGSGERETTLRAPSRRRASLTAGECAVEFRKLLGRFVDVCNVIEYAHSRGIMHRDLKPENVMLGGFGETLVVDWGLAKPMGSIQDVGPPADEAEIALGSAESPATPAAGQVSPTSPTLMGSAVGTPAYMSPEQAEGRLDCVGRASDVYSLGATLYYLLTGRPAFNEPGVLRLLERVKRGEFPRPREANRSVPPALEAIVLRAMAREPARRYPSARALADDLERWMADEPVSAHRGAWSERLARWARRHRRGVQAAAVALVAITIISVMAAVLVRSAKRDLEREHALVKAALTAETEAKAEARKAIDNYVNLVTEEHALRDEHVQPLRKRLLEHALRYYQELVDKHGGKAELRQELANAILRVGRISNETGSKEEAIKAFREALVMFQRLAGEHPDDDRYQDDLALAWRSVGLLENELGQRDKAATSLRAALDIRRRLAAKHPDDDAYQRELALALFSLGVAQSGESPAALDNLQQALRIQGKLAETHPNSVEHQVDLANTHYELGRLHERAKRIPEALAHFEPSLAIRERLVAERPDDANRQSELAAVDNALAIIHYRAGHFDDARRLWEQALATRSRLARAQPMVTRFQRDLAVAYNNLAGLDAEQARFEASLERHSLALAIRRRVAADHPTMPRYQVELSDTFDNVGEALGSLGRWSEALGAFEQALAVKQKLYDQSPQGRHQSDLGAAWGHVGRALARLGRFAEALAAHQKGIEYQRLALKGSPDEPRFHELLAIHQGGVVVARLGLGRQAEAVEAEARRRELSHGRPEALYEFAAGLAGLVEWIGRGGRTLSPDERQQRRQYCEQAIEALRQALAEGLQDTNRLRTDPVWAPLADQAGFRELLKRP
ncbi:MAG TPA: serine/threonine-protein kinase [Pirellulales bacterium]|nr:serine/threonine-protein kinase [Pirellulales bacterium]